LEFNRNHAYSQYVAKHGYEAYEAKLERRRQKQLDDEGKRRRVSRPRVPRGEKRKSSRYDDAEAQRV
jgi:hypothetical protein